MKECIFTNLEIKNFNQSDEGIISYLVTIYNPTNEAKVHFENIIEFKLSYYAVEWANSNDFFINNIHVFRSLIYNYKWFDSKLPIITIDSLEALLKSREYPKTPKEKLDNLFLYLMNLQTFDGQVLEVYSSFFEQEIWNKFYFKTKSECNFYFKTLHSLGLINGTFTAHNVENSILHLNLTYEGLNHAIKLQEDGTRSNKCFVAMSFDKTMTPTRMAIKEALIETGYDPVIIDEKDIESDKTINDAIIAGLKSCNFCIADFTKHSNGVYFESGFALGQGKKVIYTCMETDFSSAHFDIKPLQHIIYKDPEELKRKLVFKIKAWVI